jgi:hypothetical protein
LVPIDDSIAENPETVQVTLTLGPGYTVDMPAGATVNVADNDSGGVSGGGTTVSVAVHDGAAAEAGPHGGSFTITRTGNPSPSLSVGGTEGVLPATPQGLNHRESA